MTSGAGVNLSWKQALAWRMRRHHLVERAPASDFLRVVGELCGLHAQVMSSAELSLWARVEGLERDAVRDALWQDRTLVKLWAMRGTLHLLPAAELGTWLSALATKTNDGNAWSEMDVLSDAVARSLDGRPLTREELAREVERRTGSPEMGEWVRFSWGSYLKATSYRGLLCFAPSENGRVLFTTPASWLQRTIERPAPESALREIARRFLAAYAPAGARRFGLWWGATGQTRSRRILELLGDEAVEVEVEGRSLWALARDVEDIAGAVPPGEARLLPAFDPWVAAASRTSDAVVDPTHRARVYRPQGWMSPVLLVDGRIAGVWKHIVKTRRVVVELEPFARLQARARRQLEAEAERLAAFLARELSLSFR